MSTEEVPEKDERGARAIGKGERRRRVVKAAHKLLAERGNDNFSMQELADRAGLSPATPYNLFGTKAAILREVFLVETEGFRKSYAGLRRKPPARRVLAVVEHIFAAYVKKPAFYRNLSRSLRAVGSIEVDQAFTPLMHAMFLPLVEDMFAERAITADVAPAVIATHLLRIFGSTFLQWASLDWDEHHFRDELASGFIITFLGFFRGRDRELLLQALESDPASKATKQATVRKTASSS